MKSKLVVTMNRFLTDLKFPLPHIKDILAAMKGEQLLTKLVLSSADNQSLLNDDAKKLYTISTLNGLFR